MSHQTIIIREEDTTLRIDQVVVSSRITDKITLPVGGGPFTFVDENGGLLLTLDKDGNIISEKGFFELSGQAAPAVSPAGKMRLYFDSATNKLRLSENAGAFNDIVGAGGDVVGPASATNNALVRWDTATGKLVQDSLVTLDGTGFVVAGDSTLVFEDRVLDSATAVAFNYLSTNLDKDTFTTGAIHSRWQDAGLDTIMLLTPDGVLTLASNGAVPVPVSGAMAFSTLGTNDAHVFTPNGTFRVRGGSGQEIRMGSISGLSGLAGIGPSFAGTGMVLIGNETATGSSIACLIQNEINLGAGDEALRVINGFKGFGEVQLFVVSSDGTVLAGTGTPDVTAVLQANSTVKGFLPPRMTTIQQDAIISPTEGLVIYNLITKTLRFFNGTVWGNV